MKSKIIDIIESINKEFIDLAEDIFKNPELGFKEFETNEKICKILDKYDIKYQSNLAITGIKATISSSKKGPHIALLCELDSVPTTNHEYLGKKDNCAHNCGHYAQIGTMLGTFIALKKLNILENFGGKISFIATPAEEYGDFSYRENLIKNKKITYMSGKQEMITLGVFDDIDLVLSCHTMPTDTPYFCELNSSLNGFLSKKIRFIGTSAHAGLNPHEGVNALNGANVALNAISYLRETFKEEDKIKVHYVITNGGTTVNSVPDLIEIDMYIRGKTVDSIVETNKKIDRALRGGALSINCDLEIINNGGYLPLVQDKNLTDILEKNILEFVSEDKILRNCHSFASGDIGDLSYILPTVQIGVAGFYGRIHGDNFRTDNYDLAYILPMKYFTKTVIDLLGNNSSKLYLKEDKLSFDEYKDLLKNINEIFYYNREED